jgi:hypothetical protein
MGELPEPYLKFGLLCDRVLQEKDGVISLVRIIDRFILTARGPEVPMEMPEQRLDFIIAMNWVGGLGKHEAKVKIIKPNREEWESATMPFFLDSLERGHNIIVNMSLSIKQEGLYWVEFLLNGRVKGRMPWRVIYERIETPSLN